MKEGFLRCHRYTGRCLKFLGNVEESTYLIKAISLQRIIKTITIIKTFRNDIIGSKPGKMQKPIIRYNFDRSILTWGSLKKQNFVLSRVI
jgi:hypothetical protein